MSRRAVSNTRMIAEIGVVAAVYAVLVYALAPVSFAVVQFRLAEVTKSLVIFRRHLIWAMAIGVGLGNLASPMAGAWELAWMPAMNLVGGYLAWLVGNRFNPFAGAALFAAWISLAVAVMLAVLTPVPFAVAFGSVLVSESVLVVGGVPLMRLIARRLEVR